MLPITEIQILFYRDNNTVVAQGLEINICGWGENREEAMQDFTISLMLETMDRQKNGGSIDDIGPAPAHFFRFADENNLYRAPANVECA